MRITKEILNRQKRITLFVIVLLIFSIGFVAISRYERKLLIEKIAKQEVSKTNGTHDDLVGGVGNTMQVSVYFQNPKLAHDPDLIHCETVFPVVRTIDRVPGVARQALQELLLGPTEGERGSGYVSAIPQEIGLHINAVTLERGILTITFNRPPFLGGSCALAGVTSQIEATAKQFNSVKEVRMLVNGSEEWRMNP